MTDPDSQAPEDATGDSKRRRILDAAFEVSRERGVHAARMEEVAARAQVSKGTLYRFFENKEDLFLEMMIDSYQRARQAVEPLDPERSAAENLRRRLQGLAKVLDVTAPRSRVHYQAFGVVGDSPEASAKLYEFLSAFHRERYAEYEELVRAGQIEGAFRSDIDPGLVAHMISGLISGFIYRASFDAESAPPESLQACFETVFTDVLRFQTDARPSHEEADA